MYETDDEEFERETKGRIKNRQRLASLARDPQLHPRQFPIKYRGRGPRVHGFKAIQF
jgi:hypothetical protein